MASVSSGIPMLTWVGPSARRVPILEVFLQAELQGVHAKGFREFVHDGFGGRRRRWWPRALGRLPSWACLPTTSRPSISTFGMS